MSYYIVLRIGIKFVGKNRKRRKKYSRLHNMDLTIKFFWALSNPNIIVKEKREENKPN